LPTLHICDEVLFENVKNYIREFELDDRLMEKEQFLTLSKNSELLAFGRIRSHKGFSEICSVGVLEEVRHKGLAKRIVAALIESCGQPLYLVCIIPSFFEPFGFAPCKTFPPEIQEKLDYCTANLIVPEDYVVMRRP
jgi:N-acetylglutamate synthase-like GNAT family acetyltransferase